MSKYGAVATEIESLDDVEAALKVLGVPYERHAEPAHLYGYQGDRRADRAHIIVRRQHISRWSNDLGWVARSGRIEAVVSAYDRTEANTTRIRSQVADCAGIYRAVRAMQASDEMSGVYLDTIELRNGEIVAEVAGYARAVAAQLA